MKRIQDLDTPAVLIDLDRMERNLHRAAEYTRAHRLRLRPHTKTHKIPALAKLQLQLGAAGLTVAKTSEAEVMMRAFPPELLIAYPILGAAKTARLMKLAAETQVTVSIDSIAAARELAVAAKAAGRKLGVLIELDAGLHRVGVQPGEPLRQLAMWVSDSAALEMKGLAFYPGHIRSCDPASAVSLRLIDSQLKAAKETLKQLGLSVYIVSGGSTPALALSHWLPSMNEVRPGTYIFNDRNTVLSGACTWDDCAATVLTTVVSTSVASRAILDGGSKTFSSDLAAEPGFGQILEMPDACFAKMNEEHGFVDIAWSQRRWKVGDKVRVVPNHVCVTMNLHERVYGYRGEEVVEIWEVEARGKLQ